MKRTAFATLSLLATAVVSSCSLVFDAAGDDPQDPTPGAFAADMLAATDGDSPAAAVALVLAVDAGYTLDQVVDAAESRSLGRDGVVRRAGSPVPPEGVAQDVVAAAAVGAAGSNGRVSTVRILHAGVITEGELSLFFDEALGTLESRGAELMGEDRARAQQQEDFDAPLVVLTAKLVEAGYSVEQIVEATVFGEAVCEPLFWTLVAKANPAQGAPTSCSIPGVEPALAPQHVFSTEIADAGPTESAADSPASAPTSSPTSTPATSAPEPEPEPAAGLAPGLYIGQRAEPATDYGPGATDDVSLVVSEEGFEVSIISRQYAVVPVLRDDNSVQECALTIETTTFGVAARDDNAGRALSIPAVRSESITHTECPSKKPAGPTGPDEDVEVRGVVDQAAGSVVIKVGPDDVAMELYDE